MFGHINLNLNSGIVGIKTAKFIMDMETFTGKDGIQLPKLTHSISIFEDECTSVHLGDIPDGSVIISNVHTIEGATQVPFYITGPIGKNVTFKKISGREQFIFETAPPVYITEQLKKLGANVEIQAFTKPKDADKKDDSSNVPKENISEKAKKIYEWTVQTFKKNHLALNIGLDNLEEQFKDFYYHKMDIDGCNDGNNAINRYKSLKLDIFKFVTKDLIPTSQFYPHMLVEFAFNEGNVTVGLPSNDIPWNALKLRSNNSNIYLPSLIYKQFILALDLEKPIYLVNKFGVEHPDNFIQDGVEPICINIDFEKEQPAPCFLLMKSGIESFTNDPIKMFRSPIPNPEPLVHLSKRSEVKDKQPSSPSNKSTLFSEQKNLQPDPLTFTDKESARLKLLDAMIAEATKERFELVSPTDEVLFNLLKEKIPDGITINCRFYKLRKECELILDNCEYESTKMKFLSLIKWNNLSSDHIKPYDDGISITFDLNARNKLLTALRSVVKLDIVEIEQDEQPRPHGMR